MHIFKSAETLDGTQESELREFLQVLGATFPLEGRDVGNNFKVSQLNDLASKTFKAHNGQVVLLSFAINDRIYPLSIFFIEAETLKFGHATLLLSERKDPSLLPILQEALRGFFARNEEDLLSSLHTDWLTIRLTGVVDRRIFWDQEPNDVCRPSLAEIDGLPKVSVLPSVYHFNNPYFKHLLEISMPDIKQGDRVLIMGSGVGLDAVIVAKKTRTPVDAVDINPLAVLNTVMTATRAGMTNYINAWPSDLFQEVHERYDAILFNAPLVIMARPDSDSNRFDFKGSLLKRLLQQLPNHLLKNGRLYIMSHPEIAEYIPTGLRSKLRSHFQSAVDYGIHEVRVEPTLKIPATLPNEASEEQMIRR